MRQATTAWVVVGLALLAAPAADAKRRPPVPPAPPHVEYVHETPPGWAPSEIGEPFKAAAAGATIYLSRTVDRWTLNHELGHVFDWLVLTDADRASLAGVMRLQGPWVPDGDCFTDTRCPSEWFADWYANGRLRCGPSLGNCWEDGYAESPRSARQYRRFLTRVHNAYERYRTRTGPAKGVWRG